MHVKSLFISLLLPFLLIGCGGGKDANTAASPVKLLAQSAATITPQSGWWWNPAEGGRGFTIEKQGDNIFMAGYLYDANGRASWVAAGPSPMVGTTFDATLTSYKGGQTLTGTYKSVTSTASSGNINIVFTDSTHATMTWPGGRVPIERYNIVPGGVAATPAAGAPETGWWWNANEGGRGYAIEIQNGTMYMAGYMYDNAGNPIWYASGPTAMTAANTYQGVWQQYGNGQTLAGAFKPASVVNSNVGSISITFSSTRNAMLTLPNGSTMFLSRYAFGQSGETGMAPSLEVFAGNMGGFGSNDGTGAAAHFRNSRGTAIDHAGNLYVADYGNHVIRKITQDGLVTTLAGKASEAGSDDGVGAAARFNHPTGVALDSEGNVFVSEFGNHTIRKITPAGLVTTFAGTSGRSGTVNGVGAMARFTSPTGLTVDYSGNVYVADNFFNSIIRKITPDGVVTTYTGLLREGAQAGYSDSEYGGSFVGLAGMVADIAGNIYACDYGGHTIRKITPSKVVTTYAGTPWTAGNADGIGGAASFSSPTGIAIDSSGNLYVADSGNNTIRKITPSRMVTTLAGSPTFATGSADGVGAAASFFKPYGLSLDSMGTIYVTDSSNNTIRKITQDAAVTTMAGMALTFGSADGMGTAASFSLASGLTTIERTGESFTGISYSNSLATDDFGNVYVADSGNHTIRKITPAGMVTTFAGTPGISGSADGLAATSSFYYPRAVATDHAGNVYVADNNAVIRKITPGGVVTTLAGTAGVYGSADGIGAAASFNAPFGLAVDSAGNVYVIDGYYTVRKITPYGEVTTLAGTYGISGNADGTGPAASFEFLQGIAIDSADNIYVADSSSYNIRKITQAGVVTTFAGTTSMPGNMDGTLATARFFRPLGIAIDGVDNIYVADDNSYTIRKIARDGMVTTVAGTPGLLGFKAGPLPGTLAGVNGIAISGSSLYIATANGIAVVRNRP